MATKTLIKNRRFKAGTMVNLLYNPVFDANTTSITDTTAAGLYQITATFDEDLTPELFSVGDICAFSFGVGTISAKNQFNVVVDFPNSMFPDTDIMRFVGSEFQNTLFFLEDEYIIPNLQVSKYVEQVEQATYGYAKSIYNRQSVTTLKLVPIKRIDDGKLSQALVSSGYVLRSCDDENYDNDVTGWQANFPIQLSGSSIDPIYRRGYLAKRILEASGLKNKSTMDFLLIG